AGESRMATGAAVESATAMTTSRGECDTRRGNRKNQKQRGRQRQQPLQDPHLLPSASTLKTDGTEAGFSPTVSASSRLPEMADRPGPEWRSGGLRREPAVITM